MGSLGVEPIKPRYLNATLAAFYTGKTIEQIRHAVKRGHLSEWLAKDGSRSFRVEDLDEYMTAMGKREAKAKANIKLVE